MTASGIRLHLQDGTLAAAREGGNVGVTGPFPLLQFVETLGRSGTNSTAYGLGFGRVDTR